MMYKTGKLYRRRYRFFLHNNLSKTDVNIGLFLTTKTKKKEKVMRSASYPTPKIKTV